AVVAERSRRPAELERGRERSALATVEVERAAGIRESGLGLDLDDAGRAESVLRRQRAGQKVDRVGEAGRQGLGETGDALRQRDPVQAVLVVSMVPPDVALPHAFLTRRASEEKRRIWRGIMAPRLARNVAMMEVVLPPAGRREDVVPRPVEALGTH